MNIDLAQSINVTNLSTSASTITAALSNTTPGNAFWFVAMEFYNNTFSGVPTDTQSNTFTAIGSPVSVSTNVRIGQWGAGNIKGGAAANTVSVSLGFADTQRVGILAELTPARASPVDGFGTGSNTTGTALSTTANASSANTIQPALMLSYGWCLAGTTLVANGGTGVQNISPSGAGGIALVQKQFMQTIAQQSAAMTANASGVWAIVMALFDQGGAWPSFQKPHPNTLLRM